MCHRTSLFVQACLPASPSKPQEPNQRLSSLRLELAALYRIFDYLGWTEMIYNHITVRVPGPDRHYLINPYGLNYDEVTASNLVKVGFDGVAVDGSKHMVNVAGFVIHSAIHAARDDAHCVIHTHTTAGMAIACKKDGFRFDNFYSAQLSGRLAFHDFEGITTDVGEQERLVKSLGDKNIMVLRNHGLLTHGPTIPAALQKMYMLERACELELIARGLGEPPVEVAPEVVADLARILKGMRAKPEYGLHEWNALVRVVDAKGSDFRR